MCYISRPIFAGLLHNLEHFPPEAVLSILTTLQDRVLGMGDAIPGQLQVEPFGDTAMSQVMPCVQCRHHDASC